MSSYLQTIREVTQKKKQHTRKRPQSANTTKGAGPSTYRSSARNGSATRNTNAIPRRPASTSSRRKSHRRGRGKDFTQPDWVVTAMKRRQRGSSPTSTREQVMLKTYQTSNSSNSNSNNGTNTGGSGGNRKRNHKTQGPWDHYGKEEQYERILQLRAKVTTQEGELRALRLRLLKAEREKSKAEQGIEKSIGKAAHVMAEALRNAGGSIASGTTDGRAGGVNIGGVNIGGGVGSDQRMIGRLRNQIRQLTHELSQKDQHVLDLKRTTHYARTTELHVELDEYRREVSRLRNLATDLLKQQRDSSEHGQTNDSEMENDYDADFEAPTRQPPPPPPPPTRPPSGLKELNYAEATEDQIMMETEREEKEDSNNNGPSSRGRIASRVSAKRRSRSAGNGRTTKRRGGGKGGNGGGGKSKKKRKRILRPTSPSVAARRSKLGALAAVIASLLPLGDANAVSFARLLQSLTRELASITVADSVSMDLFLETLANVVECNIKDVPPSLIVLLEDNHGLNMNGEVRWSEILHDLLTRVDVWDLFSGPSLPQSTLPKQIANVVQSQQSRIQAMQSEINLQREKYQLKLKKEIELRKEIDALTREGGRGSVLRQRKMDNLNDINLDEIQQLENILLQKKQPKRTKNEIMSARKRLYGGSGGGGGGSGGTSNALPSPYETEDMIKASSEVGPSRPHTTTTISTKARRPQSAARKRPQSAARKRPTTVEGFAKKEGLRSSTSSTSKNGNSNNGDAQSIISLHVTTKKINTVSPTARTVDGSSSSNNSNSSNNSSKAELSLSASKKSSEHREELLKRRRELIYEREQQKIQLQLQRDARTAKGEKERKQRELLMEGIGKTAAVVQEQHQTALAIQSSSQEATAKGNAQDSNLYNTQNTEAEDDEDNEAEATDAVKSAVQKSAHEMAAKKTMSMTKKEMYYLQQRFRAIIRHAVSTGSFLNTSFTGKNGSLNVSEFTKYMMETDGDEVLQEMTTSSTGSRTTKEGTFVEHEKLTEAQVLWFVGILDTNGDGRVDYREFLHFTYNTTFEMPDDEENADGSSRTSSGSSGSSGSGQDLKYQVDSFAKDLSNIFMDVVNSGKVSDFRDIFQAMDEDNSGTVSHDEFMVALEDFDFQLPNDSVRHELLRRFDHDGDGSINYLEFVNFCLAYAMDGEATGRSADSLRDTNSGGNKDTPEHRVRIALSHFLETHGGAVALSKIFIQINEQTLGNGVDTGSMVSGERITIFFLCLNRPLPFTFFFHFFIFHLSHFSSFLFTHFLFSSFSGHFYLYSWII